MELKKIGIMILCLIVVFAISTFKILEQKRVEKILNEEIDLRLEGVDFEDVDFENFQVYKSHCCDNSTNQQCPYPPQPIYESYF